MFEWLTGRREDRRKAGDIYGAVVAQSRNPAFYTAFQVDDSTVGRYEMIALTLAVTLDRLGAEDVADEELRRILVETFVTDMDDAMREMGIGDNSVPRNVKKAAGGLYERGLAYRTALRDAGDAPIEAALATYVYATTPGADARPLARYVRRLHAHLASQPADALRAGQVEFPSPANDAAATHIGRPA